MHTTHHPTAVERRVGPLPAVRAAPFVRWCARQQAAAAPNEHATLPSASAPAETVTAMRQPVADLEPSPAAGELWHLTGNGTAAPAVIAAARDHTLRIWAVGEDPEFADAGTVIVGPGLLGISFGVWTTLEFDVPRHTAERRLGPLDPTVHARLRTVRSQITTGHHPGGDGAAFTSDLDPRLTYRAQLAVPIRALTGSPSS